MGKVEGIVWVRKERQHGEGRRHCVCVRKERQHGEGRRHCVGQEGEAAWGR